MTSFLDTSALFKLYHTEEFSDALALHLQHTTSAYVISVLTKAELISAGWKKVRSTQKADNAFDTASLQELLAAFEEDDKKFDTLPADVEDWSECEELLHRCNSAGRKLHTPDALQLVAALKLGAYLDEFITFDKGLREAAKFVGLHVPDL